jgi:hypothetical protein
MITAPVGGASFRPDRVDRMSLSHNTRVWVRGMLGPVVDFRGLG